MKALRTLTILFALALMCLPAPSAAAAEKPFKLDICAMPEHESFIFWYAKEQGWDKDEGLDFQIHFFQTGMDQLEALPAKQWVVGGTGTVPILVGALRYNTYLIGIANDESWVNAVTVRPDNPALKVKGWNPEYPNLLGSPETVKGKTFLYTQSSSQHFGMSEYLKALGLTEKDVVMQNMDPAQVLADFAENLRSALPEGTALSVVVRSTDSLSVEQMAELFDRLYVPAKGDLAAVKAALPEGYDPETRVVVMTAEAPQSGSYVIVS